MNAVPFDTLKLARKLEASGMTGAMAAGTAEALAEAMGGAEVATKADIAGVRAEIAEFEDRTEGRHRRFGEPTQAGDGSSPP